MLNKCKKHLISDSVWEKRLDMMLSSYALWRFHVMLGSGSGMVWWYPWKQLSSDTCKSMMRFHTNTDSDMNQHTHCMLKHGSVLKFPALFLILKPSMCCTREWKTDLLCTHENEQEKEMIFWACQNDAYWVLRKNPQKVKFTLIVRDSFAGEWGLKWRDSFKILKVSSVGKSPELVQPTYYIPSWGNPH